MDSVSCKINITINFIYIALFIKPYLYKNHSVVFAVYWDIKVIYTIQLKHQDKITSLTPCHFSKPAVTS